MLTLQVHRRAEEACQACLLCVAVLQSEEQESLYSQVYHSKYEQLKQQYGITILPKEFYPKVDIVISYDSTLADEYENVGITVIRHDTIQNCNEVESLIIDRNK